MEKLFKKLHLFGGAIVRECDVTPGTKAYAHELCDTFVDAEGMVFIWVRSIRSSGIGWRI